MTSTQVSASQGALDTHGVAALLGVCHMTVLRLINRGQLPAVKIGRVWRVRQADVEALLAGTLS
ncbi:MAG: Helix-turn-helix domain [Mycobacterium sp.]|jgi:excisionase family DNA binding protein|nr:Helix-turn-helix domain [Mycobacterium sp.]